MRTTSRFAAFLLGGLTILGVPVRAQSDAAGPQGAERLLFDAANHDRAARRLHVLRWDAALARAAREHALLMARRNTISHQFPGEPGLSSRVSQAGARFTLIAENVGNGYSAPELHDAWMKSPPHRANLLDPKADAVGIALVDRNEQFFAVEDFARLLPSLSLEEQERQVGELLAARGLRLLNASRDVRRTCALNRDVAPGQHPKYLFRYLTAEIREMPEELLSELRARRYQSAAVGACESADDNGFASYRIAVLLY